MPSETTIDNKAEDLIHNERTDWLRTLGCAERAALAYPFEHKIGGHRFIICTNGTAVTGLRAEDGEFTVRKFDRIAEALSLMEGATIWHEVGFLPLWRWLMEWETRCGECGGVGFRFEPELVAFDSNGGGPATNLWQQCGCMNKGRMLGVPFDKLLLLKQIGPLTPAMATVSVGSDPVRRAVFVRSRPFDKEPPDWFVIVLGLTDIAGPVTDTFEIGQ